VPGFKEHFIEKYFAYRRRYVDHIAREAPQRASLANLSELARLSFMVAGNVLCALILWALALGAASHDGGFAFRPLAFDVLALIPTGFAAMAAAGFAVALGARRARQP